MDNFKKEKLTGLSYMEIISLIAFVANESMKIDEIAFLVCSTPEKLRNLLTSEKGICVLQTLINLDFDFSKYTISKDREIPEALKEYLSMRSQGYSETLLCYWYFDPDERLIELGVIDEE